MGKRPVPESDHDADSYQYDHTTTTLFGGAELITGLILFLNYCDLHVSSYVEYTEKPGYNGTFVVLKSEINPTFLWSSKRIKVSMNVESPWDKR